MRLHLVPTSIVDGSDCWDWDPQRTTAEQNRAAAVLCASPLGRTPRRTFSSACAERHETDRSSRRGTQRDIRNMAAAVKSRTRVLRFANNDLTGQVNDMERVL